MTTCTYCGAARMPGQMHVCNAATVRREVIRTANAYQLTNDPTVVQVRPADPPALPPSDLPAMRARAERAVSIGGDQTVLKQLARDVLVLMDAVGLV